MKNIILKTGLPPGDVITLTAAIESLHKTYPNEYITDVITDYPAIWENNPHIKSLKGYVSSDTGQVIEMHYPTVNESSQIPHNFLSGFTTYLGKELNIPLNLAVNKPYLYLSDEEKIWVSQIKEITNNDLPFWIINSGGKTDFPLKVYPFYQQIINGLLGKVQFVQIGKLNDYHQHPLENVISLINKTDLRQLIRLVYHCQGALGPVTLLQHLCAAWEKPYVCIAGGREGTQWISSYIKQHTFHSIGTMPCCLDKACWKSKIKDCPYTLKYKNYNYPKCLMSIKPEQIIMEIERIISY